MRISRYRQGYRQQNICNLRRNSDDKIDTNLFAFYSITFSDIITECIYESYITLVVSDIFW